MGRVSSLTLVDSGRYYSTNPTVLIGPPDIPAAYVGKIDSSFAKFGVGSLEHDSTDVSIAGRFQGDNDSDFVMQSFWFYLDSLRSCTLTWSPNFRTHINGDNNLAITYRVNAVDKDSNQTDNVQVRSFTSNAVQAQRWHFAKFETFNNNLRIGLDSNHTATIIMGADFYNDLDQIRFGRDSGNLSPIHRHLVGSDYVYDSDLFISFAGHIDQFALTIDSTKTAFDSAFSAWVPSSDSNDRYENKVPLIEENFNYKRATARATIDSSIGEVNALFITDSGFGYDSAPTVRIIGGNNIIDSDYDIGDNIRQALSSTTMRGEVSRYQLDSDADSNRYLYLIHCGADDGKFHDFIADAAVINTTNNSVSGLTVKSAIEINKLSNNEQNTDFSSISDDFLDFSEDNPFGDPENN